MELRKKECQKSHWNEINPGDVFIDDDDIYIKVEKKETKDGFIFNAIGLSDGRFYYMPANEKYEALKDCYLVY